MTTRNSNGLAGFAPQAANYRRHGRLLCQDISCSLGAVLDISASGMRVRSGTKPPLSGQQLTLTLETLDACVLISATVVWSRRSGIFRHDVGLEFGELSKDVRSLLNQLARAAAYNESLVPRQERAG
jgi:hypothetical protein